MEKLTLKDFTNTISVRYTFQGAIVICKDYWWEHQYMGYPLRQAIRLAYVAWCELNGLKTNLRG